MENFSVNECVICTHDFVMRGGEQPYLKRVPILGASYLVRKILEASHKGAGTFLLLEEIVNPEYNNVEDDSRSEVGFNSKFFEPADKKTTSIAVFHDILNNINNDSYQENQP
jgi:hypothetical protein